MMDMSPMTQVTNLNLRRKMQIVVLLRPEHL